MFYVKTRLDKDTVMETDIRGNNVFCHCPHCSKEVDVDFGDLIGAENPDLLHSSVLCDTCGEAYIAEVTET